MIGTSLPLMPSFPIDHGRAFSHDQIEPAISQPLAEHSSGRIAGVISIAEDASRLGNPAEETVLYEWWDSRRKQGFWLIPEALRGDIV